MQILNVGYGSSNYYVVGPGPRRLLVDIGWPGTLPRLQHNLQRYGLPFRELAALLITHYHPDHAGLAQELRNLGVHLLVMETQLSGFAQLAATMKPSNHYVPIVRGGHEPLTPAASRLYLATLNIAGQIIPTPGHSEDSVSLLTDDGAAFTGDLPPALGEGQDNYELVAESWQTLRTLGAVTIYPGHGPVRPLEPA